MGKHGVLPFGGAHANPQNTPQNQNQTQFAPVANSANGYGYGKDSLQSELAAEEMDAQLDADAWQMVTDMVAQSKVSSEVEVEKEKEKELEQKVNEVEVEMELEMEMEGECEDDLVMNEEEEAEEESEASDVYQVIFEAMTIQEGAGVGAGARAGDDL